MRFILTEKPRTAGKPANTPTQRRVNGDSLTEMSNWQAKQTTATKFENLNE